MSETESFESVMDTLLNGFTHDVRTDELSGSYKMIAARLDRLKAAHDREIRDTTQQQYDRGFNAGRHSMDAEHRAIAMRLRALPLDGGSHENLSQIARAVYHADFGWTQGACASLRDELVRLMGGVSDDTCDSQCRGACAADCGRDSGKHEEVGHGGTADDCADDPRGGSRGKLVHMDGLVAYDVLDNERRKAIAELRKMPNGYPEYASAPFARWYAELCEVLGVETGFGNVRDRLIHLLGGDQPSGIDVLRAMDDGHSRTCPKSDEEMSKNAPSVSITDELRKWADGDVWSCKWEEFKAIADRIDEQFDRICQQHEAVLQSTIDGMVKEYEHDRLPDQLRIEKLEKQRDHWHQQATDMMNHADAMEHERDDLQAKLDEATHDVEMWRDRAEDMRMERDELQSKLDAIRDALDG